MVIVDVMSEPNNDYFFLLEHAKKAMLNAYSPYSGFKVGAAVLTKAGAIFSGTNVENMSFGLTICAERSAIVSALSSGVPSNEIRAIGITATGDFFSPCGACRQFIHEFGEDIVVVFPFGEETIVEPISQLLPYAFVKA